MAGLYERDGRLILHPWSQTRNCMWVTVEPIQIMTDPVPDAQLGAAINEALDMSSRGVPNRDPTDETQWTAIARQLGERTYRRFLRGTRAVMIDRTEMETRFRPTRPPKSPEKGSGFLGLPEPVVVAHNPTEERIGRSAREALERSVRHH
jgi:hypothetical protein